MCSGMSQSACAVHCPPDKEDQISDIHRLLLLSPLETSAVNEIKHRQLLLAIFNRGIACMTHMMIMTRNPDSAPLPAPQHRCI